MGYFLRAFIGKQEDIIILTRSYKNAVKIDIGQGISIIPMTEDLFSEIINSLIYNNIDNFEFLTEFIEQKVLDFFNDKKISYVQAEYHGGKGGQTAIVWENKRRKQIWDFGQNRINQVLIGFGVIAEYSKDEFDTLNLGRFRNTEDWIKE